MARQHGYGDVAELWSRTCRTASTGLLQSVVEASKLVLAMAEFTLDKIVRKTCSVPPLSMFPALLSVPTVDENVGDPDHGLMTSALEPRHGPGGAQRS